MNYYYIILTKPNFSLLMSSESNLKNPVDTDIKVQVLSGKDFKQQENSSINGMSNKKPESHKNVSFWETLSGFSGISLTPGSLKGSSDGSGRRPGIIWVSRYELKYKKATPSHNSK